MKVDQRDCIAIPQPPGYPLVGNIFDIGGDEPIQQLADLGKQYGEIYSLTILGKKQIIVSSAAIMAELCDETRFEKTLGRALKQLRSGLHDGLFTAYNDEENWGIAHRTLVPAFGPLNIRGMFDEMKDIASQLVLKWARHGTAYNIPVADDLTRLTLDTLALCAMDYRFNSFYTEEMHPFVASIVNFLKYADVRSKRPAWLTSSWYKADEAKWEADIAYMRNLSGDLVRQRRENPKESKDLLNAMVNSKDPRTGKALPEESIIDNMITFLIAGHETTSGMLSYCFYCLLKNPQALRKAQEEVDRVIGKGTVEYEHLSQLPYITAVLRETARLHSTAPGMSLTPKDPNGEVVAGKYFVERGDVLFALLHNIHRDPEVYGDDAEEFRPERMLDENFDKLPPTAWKPFGNGARGCIGRPFAWQEMMLVLPMLLQYFDFSLDNPSYHLQTAFTLTIKPKDLHIRASLREGWTARSIEQHLSGFHDFHAEKEKAHAPSAPDTEKKGKPITILYGSNSGTCEVFAQTLAADASSHGFSASRVDTLNSAKQNLPTDEPIVIVTASYEGEPTDNAAHFYEWLKNTKADDVKAPFAVFGCGHSDWKQTFHRIPKSLDSLLEQAGGTRICEMGSADAAKGDMMSDFQNWEDVTLWPALQKQFGGEDEINSESNSLTQALSVEVFSRRASHLRSDVSEAKVITAKKITADGVAVKKHIELQLPSSMKYRAGDYCAVLPLNPLEVVHRVMTRFSLAWDAMLSISSRTGTTLPTEHPISAHDLFSAYVELSQPATTRNLNMLRDASDDEATQSQIAELLENFETEITEKRVSLLDLLERFPNIHLPLSAFIASLISMRVRQYSISSSPLTNPNAATLTFAVLDEPSISGQGRHVGVASNYLNHLQPGDIVHCAVKPSHAAFHLPSKPETTPIIMIAAGAGLAPFRGFVQERAAQIASGRKLAPAHLYFGCRHPDKDDLYREELDFWEQIGAVTTHRSFSQAPDQSNGHKHINEVLLEDKDILVPLWESGARLYACGSRGLGESVKQAFLKLAKEKAIADGNQPAEVDEKLEEWFNGLRNERYATDVFA